MKKRSYGKDWDWVKTINLNNLGCLTIKRGNKMNEEVEKWTLEDGRRVEKVVTENKLGEELERITEFRIDEERPLKIQQKIVEKIKPIIYERVSENLNIKTGEVIDKKIEHIDFQLKNENEDSFVTKKEMVDAIVTAIKSIKKNNVVSNNSPELKSLGLVQEVESVKNKTSIRDWILLGVIVLQIIGLIYLIVF